MMGTLARLSQGISHIAASAAPLLSAIRIGSNRHITGLVCEGNLIVTSDQALPVLDRFTVALASNALVSARPGLRDPIRNLAILHLGTPWPVANPEIAATLVGDLVVIVGADSDASPVVRLALVHRFLRTAEGPAPMLDLSRDRIDLGSLVLDANGRLIGLVALGPNEEAMAIPSAMIGRTLMPNQTFAPVPPPSSNRRGWLGVALQPITVPDALVGRAGQSSGRMVVSITRGGPAETAGLRIGDVLLALNGISASGPQALRAFLGRERIGSNIEIKLLRDGNIVAVHVAAAYQPA